MTPQTLVPNQIVSNSSLKIAKKGISKSRTKFSDLESVQINHDMSQEEFIKWIEEAENSPSLSLDEYNSKWEKFRNELIIRHNLQDFFPK